MKPEVVIFDTNIYIDHYLGYSPLISLFDQLIDEGNEIHMPSIIAMELMWYDKVETDENIKAARLGYIQAADKIIDITIDIALKAAEITRI